MMCPVIANPAKCKICAAVHYVDAKNLSAAEIHRVLHAAVYSQNVMSEGTVRQWCRMFKDGQTDVHDEERSGWLAISSD
jgi:hypothetical protein